MPRTEAAPPPAPPPDRTVYRVAYTLAGERAVRRAEVAVVPGYSQEGDIPRILAARLTGNPADGRRIVLLDVRER
ncbi:hypothetical protein ACF9IK_30895 [Kitasatospora hibisci]|uniref:hypothetical protein n=1 Tax=Kitasatospora hibisci TaxID=3369522 RepID=UPI0037544548